MQRYIPRRRILLPLAAALGAAIAGAIAIAATRHEEPRAFSRAATIRDVLPSRAVGFLHPGDSRRVATFASAEGNARGVFVNRSQDGSQICMWDTDLASGAQGGGCNPADDFFAGHAFTMSLGYDGGPTLATVRDARIVGVVTDGVGTLEVIYADGTARRVAITADRGFAYTIPAGLLRRGIGPVAVIARTSAGAVIDRQVTGIG